MKFKIFSLLLIFSITPLSLFSAPEIKTSLFGNAQNFWDSSKKTGKISVLPVYIKEYKESKPCDSCHWLSQNGLEFVLDNYLLRLAEAKAPQFTSELIHPENQFLETKKFDIEKMVTGQNWPWDKIFYGYNEKLIYREKDTFTHNPTKETLNKLGGALGASHLFIMKDFKMNVYPVVTNDHMGKLSFQFYLLFWNVKLAYPEWIIFFKTKTGIINLDKTIDKYLEKHLTKHLLNLPKEISNYQQKEPK